MLSGWLTLKLPASSSRTRVGAFKQTSPGWVKVTIINTWRSVALTVIILLLCFNKCTFTTQRVRAHMSCGFYSIPVISVNISCLIWSVDWICGWVKSVDWDHCSRWWVIDTFTVCDAQIQRIVSLFVSLFPSSPIYFYFAYYSWGTSCDAWGCERKTTDLKTELN